MAIRAVFTDVDGTVVSSESRNRRAIEDVARVGGYIIAPSDWDVLGGQGDNVIWQKIVDRAPHFKDVFNTAASFERGCVNMKIARIGEVKKIQEVADTLRLFRENAVSVAAVSNSVTEDAGASLNQAGYKEEDFTFTLFRDEIQRRGLRTKPYPDPYEEAMRDMNKNFQTCGANIPPLSPRECLVLEDSKTGARAGLQAGMSVIHILDEDSPLENKERDQLLTQGGVYIPLKRADMVRYCQANFL